MQLEEVDFIIREEMHMPQIHWEDLLSSARRVPLEAHPCQLEVLHVLVKPAYGQALLEDSAAEADRGMRVEEAAGTAVVKERQYRQPDAAAAAAGRMMLAILPADTLPLNTHPGTQRSSARLRARLPRDTARGAGLFTLCRRRIVLGVGQGLSARRGCRVQTVLQILTALHLQQHAQPVLRIHGLVLGQDAALQMLVISGQRCTCLTGSILHTPTLGQIARM